MKKTRTAASLRSAERGSNRRPAAAASGVQLRLYTEEGS